MNAIVDCLEKNQESLPLERYGFSRHMRYVLRTPQFRASRHVVLLLIPEGAMEPTLVVKVPRLSDDRDGIEREAQALSAIQSRAAGMADSIPQCVGVIDCFGHSALVQTALTGRPLDPATIRRDREQACHDVTSWLIKFHLATAAQVDDRAAWCESQITTPLNILAEAFRDHADDLRLVERTRAFLQPLRDVALPSVIEHGDVGHPNLFRLHSGGIGVIDWELAEPNGVPLLDLYFFLSYAAGAQVPSSSGDPIDAFRQAFLEPNPWTKPHIERYLGEMKIPREAVAPLFVLTWTRYLAELARRLFQENELASNSLLEESSRNHLTNWLRNNRYHAFWRQAVLKTVH